MDASQFLLEILASGAVSAVLVGALAWLFKTQIGHWLNKDIELIKARHQRELEGYKVSLIAETERTKARQEINKAMAVLLVEKKFAALHRLHLAVEHQASTAIKLLFFIGPETREADIKEANLGVTEFTKALRSASMYFTVEELETFYRLANMLQRTIGFAMVLKERPSDKDIEGHEVNLYPCQKAVNDIIAKRFSAMLALED